MTDWTNAEIMRRLEEVTGQQREILREMREDRALMAATYVRQDVYDARHNALKKDVEEIDERLDKAEAFKRSIITGVSVGAIMLLINLMLALSNFIAVKGG
jgi:galactokinase/mevalonate kinase-like predicted kinase